MRRLKRIWVLLLAAALCLSCFAVAASAAESNGWIYFFNNENETVIIRLYAGLDEDIEVPRTITGYPVFEIAVGAFENNKTITRITIPTGISMLGTRVFGGCENLEFVEIADSVTSISGLAFLNCKQLKTVNLPKNLTTIQYGLFWGCSSLVEMTIPDGVVSIEGYVFTDCSNLETLTIPDSVTSIGEHAIPRTARIICSPNSYAAQWARENGIPINDEPAITRPSTPTITGTSTLGYKDKTKLTGNHPDIVWGGSNEFIKVHTDGTVESLQNFTKTGKTTVTATLGDQTAKFEVNVEPTPLQWFLIITCFGWIWM